MHRKTQTLAAIAGATALLVGCTESKYQKRYCESGTFNKSGYSCLMLNEHEAQITYTPALVTDYEKMDDFALLSAAEFTLKKAYNKFTITESHYDPIMETYTTAIYPDQDHCIHIEHPEGINENKKDKCKSEEKMRRTVQDELKKMPYKTAEISKIACMRKIMTIRMLNNDDTKKPTIDANVVLREIRTKYNLTPNDA